MKKIGIILFKYGLGDSPLLVNSAFLLELEGYEVHIFIDADTFRRTRIDFERTNIAVHALKISCEAEIDTVPSSLPDKFVHALSTNRMVRQLNLDKSAVWARAGILYRRILFFSHRMVYSRGAPDESLYRNTAAFFPGLFEFYQRVAPEIDNDYVCIIGVEPMGLIGATMIAQSHARQKRLSMIYYNMELLLEQSAGTVPLRALKSLERYCIQLCDGVVIQNKERGDYFVRDNKVPIEKLLYVPISGLREIKRDKDDYFRDLFGIGPDKRIILDAGDIAASHMSLQLAEAASEWGDDFVLILHGPNREPNGAYLDRVRRIARDNKVYVSTNLVGWEQVPELISSADIGLLFLEDIDPNFREIGQSSNRLVQYLQVGLPVITVDFPSLKRVLSECRCGETANNPSHIESAARQIFSDYSTYRDNAFRCYEAKYRISTYFGEVLERIRQMEKQTLP
jgi:glycosyltransferase involved in cell wall biosynthesis